MNAHAQIEAPEAVFQAPARVLVVDDTPQNLKLLEDLLGFQGYEVEAASSGEEALAMIRDRMPDLVLLDVLMPGMSGYDVCRAIRAEARLAMLPVVMITALEDRLGSFDLCVRVHVSFFASSSFSTVTSCRMSTGLGT